MLFMGPPRRTRSPGNTIPFPHGEAETEPHRRSQLTGPWQYPTRPFLQGWTARFRARRGLGVPTLCKSRSTLHPTLTDSAAVDASPRTASTYQCDPTDVVGNPSNQLQSNDVAHGETLLEYTGQLTGHFDFQARHRQHDSILLSARAS